MLFFFAVSNKKRLNKVSKLQDLKVQVWWESASCMEFVISLVFGRSADAIFFFTINNVYRENKNYS